MKLLKNRILYDSNKGIVILKVETSIETRTLLKGKSTGHYFEVFRENNLPDKIIPMEHEEAFDFCVMHKDKFEPRKYDQLMIMQFKKFLPTAKKKLTIPKNARLIGEFDDEQLWFFAGDQFILKTPDETKMVHRSAALDFVEKFQDRFNPDRLDNLMKNVFPTTYRRP